MNGKRVLSMVGAVVLVGGATALVLLPRHRSAQGSFHAAPSATAHAGLDWATAPLDTAFNAPEGQTPCETAYNSMRAAQDAASASGHTPLYAMLAPHDDFIAACNQIPAAAQPCLVPRYRVAHGDECVRLQPPHALLDQMYKAIPKPPDDSASQK